MTSDFERAAGRDLRRMIAAGIDHTRLFWEGGRLVWARSNVYLSDGSIDSTEFCPCPSCGTMRDFYDDGEREIYGPCRCESYTPSLFEEARTG